MPLRIPDVIPIRAVEKLWFDSLFTIKKAYSCQWERDFLPLRTSICAIEKIYSDINSCDWENQFLPPGNQFLPLRRSSLISLLAIEKPNFCHWEDLAWYQILPLRRSVVTSNLIFEKSDSTWFFAIRNMNGFYHWEDVTWRRFLPLRRVRWHRFLPLRRVSWRRLLLLRRCNATSLFAVKTMWRDINSCCWEAVTWHQFLPLRRCSLTSTRGIEKTWLMSISAIEKSDLTSILSIENMYPHIDFCHWGEVTWHRF